MKYLRLGVNIDHVATIRNARGGLHPDPVRAALLAAENGADGITAHLREDRRHISDTDIRRLATEVPAPLNLEMAATGEMLEIALRHRPHAVCLVPEKREELTTEGGLDVAGSAAHVGAYVDALKGADIRVSLFVDPEERQIRAAMSAGCQVVELHTGRYCEAAGAGRAIELARLQKGAALASSLGLEVHAGHGLSYATVGPVAAIPSIVELNIGHFLVGEAIYTGLAAAIGQMREAMESGRRGSATESA
ncbi:MAG: pyridoxine 5'-phosphate synthase [Alphaproteobacteria bacterium]